MKTLLRSLLALVFAYLIAGSAIAAEVIIKNRATLRSDPSTQRAPIVILHPDEHLDLIEPAPTSGYYHVRSEEGEEGWVYSRNVEIVTEPPPTAQPTAVPSTSTVPPTADASVASIIP